MRANQMNQLLVLFLTGSSLVMGLGCGGDKKVSNQDSGLSVIKDWKTVSNQLVDEYYWGLGRFQPEEVSIEGFPKFDYDVTAVELLDKDFTEFKQNWVKRLNELLKEKRLNPELELDYRIMLQALQSSLHSESLSEKFGELKIEDLLQFIHDTMERVVENRGVHARKILESRLKKYVTGTSQSAPFIPASIEKMRTQIKIYQEKGAILFPRTGKVELVLKNSLTYRDGIIKMLTDPSNEVKELLTTLVKQTEDYRSFLTQEILPHARQELKEPAELYSDKLGAFGVTAKAEDLIVTAKAAFAQLRADAEKLSLEVAAKRGFTETGAVAVLRLLQTEKIDNKDLLLDHYQKVNKEIEGWVKDHDLVSLPEPYEDLMVEFASEATSRAVPIPHVLPPPLIKNNGEKPIFRLPLPLPGMGNIPYSELNCDASSYMLSAHEGRPGHEMQFASVIKRGVSKIRVIFAMNSANIEGWALYAETIVSPFFSQEAQLAAIQSQMMRAARAFLDPQLNLGQIDKAEVIRVLTEEVGISAETAEVEFQRYSSRFPGQATSYFFGLQQIVELRKRAEKELAGDFSSKRFHDELLNNGFLPVSISGDSIIKNLKIKTQ